MSAAIRLQGIRDVGKAQSFEDRKERRKAKSESGRLTDVEIEELRYVWHGYAAELGCRSIHGAIEAKLMRSGPRPNARKYVLEELDRASGRAPEGRIKKIVNLEWDTTAYEFRRAIHYLTLHGKVERVPVPMPAGPKDDNDAPMTAAQKEWTGYDLRLIRSEDRGAVRMRLAMSSVPRTREDRWRAQDEALEREYLTMRLSTKQGGRKSYELEESRGTGRADAILAALERVATETVLVLRAVYGGEGGQFNEAYGAEFGPIAAMAPSVARERTKMAEEIAGKRTSGNLTKVEILAMAIRQVRPVDVLRGKAKDAAFVARVRGECEALLLRSCADYRKARGRQ